MLRAMEKKRKGEAYRGSVAEFNYAVCGDGKVDQVLDSFWGFATNGNTFGRLATIRLENCNEILGPFYASTLEAIMGLDVPLLRHMYCLPTMCQLRKMKYIYSRGLIVVVANLRVIWVGTNNQLPKSRPDKDSSEEVVES